MTKGLALSFFLILLTVALAVGIYLFEDWSILSGVSFRAKTTQVLSPALNVGALD